MISKINITDLQFSGTDQNAEKLRRLMDDLRKIARGFNDVVDQLNTLSTSSTGTTAHVLATTTKLGPEHTVSGLAVSQVLIADSPTDALFRKLRFTDIDGTDFGSPLNGDVIRYVDGYFVYSSLPGFASITDPGGDAILTWSGTLDSLSWRLPGAGIGMSAGSLYVIAGGIDHGELSGLGDDDHPQYALLAGNESVTGSWTFASSTLFNSDVTLNGNFSMAATEPTLEWNDSDAATDAGWWRWHVSDGQLTLSTVSSDGGEGETVIRIGRPDEKIDAIEFSGDALTFNGGNVLTDYDDFTISGSWTFTVPQLFYGDTPTITMLDTNAGSDEFGFQVLQSADRIQIIALNSVGEPSETAVSISAVDGIVQAVNVSGDILTFNGSDVVAIDSTSTSATAGAATLPANPEGFVVFTLNGTQKKFPYYA